MKIINRFPLVMLIVSVVSAVLSVGARLGLTLTLLDAHYGVYQQGAVLDDVYHILLAAVCVLLTLCAIVKAPKWRADFNPKPSDAAVFLSCMCAFMFFGFIALTAWDSITSGAGFPLMTILELAFAVLAAVYFLFLAKRPTERKASAVFASFAPIAWCAACLIRTYFDVSTLNVSPNKVIGMMALLAAMTAFLSESRLALGAVSHRLSLAALSAAPVLLLTSALPNLILGTRLSIGESDRFLVYVIEAVFALFFWSRLLAYINYEENEDIPSDPQAPEASGNINQKG